MNAIRTHLSRESCHAHNIKGNNINTSFGHWSITPLNTRASAHFQNGVDIMTSNADLPKRNVVVRHIVLTAEQFKMYKSDRKASASAVRNPAWGAAAATVEHSSEYSIRDCVLSNHYTNKDVFYALYEIVKRFSNKCDYHLTGTTHLMVYVVLAKRSHWQQ